MVLQKHQTAQSKEYNRWMLLFVHVDGDFLHLLCCVELQATMPSHIEHAYSLQSNNGGNSIKEWQLVAMILFGAVYMF